MSQKKNKYPDGQKQCKVCLEFKSVNDFYDNRKMCKACKIKQREEYVLNNLEKVKEGAKAWRIKNKENKKEYNKKFYEDNFLKIKEFNSAWVLNKKYGLTPEQYNEILISQNGVCAICLEKEKYLSRRTKEIVALAVDHDHKTGKTRGLLCRDCNVSLGKFKDSIDILERALDYLKKHRAEND